MSDVPIGRRIRNKAHDIRHNLSARIFGSAYYEKEWSTKEVESYYWQSVGHAHRKLLVETISKYHPASALEIGCNTAPNLYLLAKNNHDIKLYGLDVSESSIQEGRKRLAEASIRNVSLGLGKADDLSGFADRSFDVVFSDAVLIYVGRDKIDRVIDEMIRVARKAIILCEWHDPGAPPRGRFLYRKGYWIRDYASLLKNQCRASDVRLMKITRDIWNDDYWSRYGYVIEVPLKDV